MSAAVLCIELFKLHMRISFKFLCAKELHMSLLIMRTCSLYSLVRTGYIRKVSVQSIQKYFLHDCSTDIISCSEQKKGIR